MSVIAVDLGGTQIRGSVVNDTGIYQNESVFSLPTDRSHDAEGVLYQLKLLLKTLIEEKKLSNLSGISISIPGLVDTSNGVVLDSLNLPGWHKIELVKIIEEWYSVPTIIENDANAGTIGEWFYSFDCKIDNLVYITIGTGIGCGIILSRKLLTGSSGIAGQIGHMSVDFDGPICHECKKGKGCLTTFASGTAIVNYIKQRIVEVPDSLLWTLCEGKVENIDGILVEKAARKKDKLSLNAFTRAGLALGQAIVNIIRLIDPQVIVLAGGVIQAGEIISLPMYQVLDNSLLEFERSCNIQITELGQFSGLAGAAANGLINLRSKKMHKYND